jgi:hypothetical protein
MTGHLNIKYDIPYCKWPLEHAPSSASPSRNILYTYNIRKKKQWLHSKLSQMTKKKTRAWNVNKKLKCKNFGHKNPDYFK